MKYIQLFEDFDNDNKLHVYMASIISKTIKEMKFDIQKPMEVIHANLVKNGMTKPMAADVANYISKYNRDRDFDPTKLDNYVDMIISFIDDKYKYLTTKPTFKWANE